MTEQQESIFKLNRKQWFDGQLKNLGFKKYKTNCLVRLTKDDILQILNFQKEARGVPEFSINICIRPLFWKNESLTLKPGFRLAENDKTDQWFSYKDEETARENFSSAYTLILEKAIAFFDNTLTPKSIVKVFEMNEYKKPIWGYSPWMEYELGLLYIKTGDLQKAFYYLEIAANGFLNSANKYLHTYGDACENIIKLLGNQEKIQRLILSMTNESITNLRLENLVSHRW